MIYICAQCVERINCQSKKIVSIWIKWRSLRYHVSPFLYNCARTPTGHTTVKQNPFGERLISTTILVSKKVFVTEILDNWFHFRKHVVKLLVTKVIFTVQPGWIHAKLLSDTGRWTGCRRRMRIDKHFTSSLPYSSKSKEDRRNYQPKEKLNTSSPNKFVLNTHELVHILRK